MALVLISMHNWYAVFFTSYKKQSPTHIPYPPLNIFNTSTCTDPTILYCTSCEVALCFQLGIIVPYLKNHQNIK